MRIGFIGLGNMGSELARHLLAAGHTLVTYARGERSRAHAGHLGLSLRTSPAEVAQASEVRSPWLPPEAMSSRSRSGRKGLFMVRRPG